MSAEKKRKNVDKIKETNKNRMEVKQKEAEAAVSLMSATYDRIHEEEERNGGLVISKAIYGNLENDTDISDSASTCLIDVTIPLQCLIRDSKLILHNSSKSDLPGFYDPCIGEEKYLKIDYLFANQSFSIQISDNEPIKLPLQSELH